MHGHEVIAELSSWLKGAEKAASLPVLSVESYALRFDDKFGQPFAAAYSKKLSVGQNIDT